MLARRASGSSGNRGGGASAYLGLRAGPRDVGVRLGSSPRLGRRPPRGAGAASRAIFCHSSWFHMGRGRSSSVKPGEGCFSSAPSRPLMAQAAAIRQRSRRRSDGAIGVRRGGRGCVRGRLCDGRRGGGRGRSRQGSRHVRGEAGYRCDGGRLCRGRGGRKRGWR